MSLSPEVAGIQEFFTPERSPSLAELDGGNSLGKFLLLLEAAKRRGIVSSAGMIYRWDECLKEGDEAASWFIGAPSGFRYSDGMEQNLLWLVEARMISVKGEAVELTDKGSAWFREHLPVQEEYERLVGLAWQLIIKTMSVNEAFQVCWRPQEAGLRRVGKLLVALKAASQQDVPMSSKNIREFGRYLTGDVLFLNYFFRQPPHAPYSAEMKDDLVWLTNHKLVVVQDGASGTVPTEEGITWLRNHLRVQEDYEILMGQVAEVVGGFQVQT